MKMLLGALGYDSEIEGYTGANWSIDRCQAGLGIGLDDGNDEFNGVKAVTREEAALYAFNTLKATMVEYDQKNTTVVGDITIKDHFQPEGCCQQRQEREHRRGQQDAVRRALLRRSEAVRRHR